MMTAEGNRARQIDNKRLKKRIERLRSILQTELTAIDADLDEIIRGTPIWRESEELLKSVPGVGNVVGPHSNRRTTGTWHPRPPQNRRPRRRRSIQPRQRHDARTTDSLRRTSPSSDGALHGRTCRLPPQSRDRRLLSTPSGGRKVQKARAHCLHAQAPRHPQCHLERARPMASRLTNKTVAHLRSLRATMSQKSSVPQAVSFVSQVLKRDNQGARHRP